jgi:hypothetical protein
MLTLEDFNAYIKRLANHDWSYEYSDDHSVYRSGQATRKVLTDLADVNPLYLKAYKAWYSYINREDPSSVVMPARERDQVINEIRTELLITA